MQYTKLKTNNMELNQPLSQKENLELLKKVREGFPGAKEAFLRHNLRLVREISNRFIIRATTCFDIDDIFSEGTIALIRSMDDFDLESRSDFSTYATVTIVKSIREALNDQRKHNQTCQINIDAELSSAGENGPSFEQVLSVGTGLDEEYIRKESLQMLKNIISSDLDEEEKKEIINLFYADVPISLKDENFLQIRKRVIKEKKLKK